MNENDRRIRKTKRALREALAKLLTEKELHAVTVRELAEEADIHRGTFYSHYQDVYDLFHQTEDNVIDELNELMKSDVEYTCEGIYTALVDYISENEKLCKAFFTKGNYSFQKRIALWLEGAYVKSWEEEESELNCKDRMGYLAAYHIEGLISIIGRWVETDFALPKSELIQLLHDVDYNIDGLFVSKKRP